MGAFVRFRVLTAVLAALLAVGFLPAPAGAAPVSVGRAPTIEARVLDLVNQIRRDHGRAPYAMHAGLRAVAREHSQNMSRAGRLSHDGFTDRLRRATPDPLQAGGGSDRGFYASGLAACENAAYRFRAGSTDETDEQVARGFAGQWWRSAPHRDCLLDVWGAGLNVTGIGVYRDSRGVWWATMEVVRDLTAPSASNRCGVDAPSVSLTTCA